MCLPGRCLVRCFSLAGGLRGKSATSCTTLYGPRTVGLVNKTREKQGLMASVGGMNQALLDRHEIVLHGFKEMKKCFESKGWLREVCVGDESRGWAVVEGPRG